MRFIYDVIARFGDNLIACVKRVLRLPVKILSKAGKFLGGVFLGVLLWFILPGGSVVSEKKESASKLIKNLARHPGRIPGCIKCYSASRSGRPRAEKIKAVVMTALPALFAVLFVFGVLFFSKMTFALRVESGGRYIGTVANESEFLTFCNGLALELNCSGADTLGLDGLKYGAVLVRRGSLTDCMTLRENILAASGVSFEYACGVYADGRLVGITDDELAVREYFDSYVGNAGSGSPGTFVTALSCDIDYREGLYPSARISDADKVISAFGEGDFPHGIKTVVSSVDVSETEAEQTEIKTDSLYAGSRRVISSGTGGLDQVTSLVTSIDGEEKSRTEVYRFTITRAVPGAVQIGTKPVDEAYKLSAGGILLWPTQGAYNINSDYGWRWGKLHQGMDIGSATGTSLGKYALAAAEGTVSLATTHSSYGYYIIIDHGDGMQTLYAHLMADSFMVKPGDRVIAGQPIAKIGSTGNSTGPHLHFEVRINGNRVDPKPWLGIE